MAKEAKRVVIDTSLWVSYLISKNLGTIDALIKKELIRVMFSIELIEELMEVTQRPKLKKYFKQEYVNDLLEWFDTYGKLVDVTTEVKLCRDPKDNFLLSLAIDSKANYLITRDNDLLDLKVFHATQIVSMPDFLTVLKQK